MNENTFFASTKYSNYLNGELVGVTKKPESKKILTKEKHQRKLITEKTNYINSQVKFQTEKRKKLYPNFNHVINASNKKYVIKDFCVHGDLNIDVNYFKFIYNEQYNNQSFYCDDCKKEYLSSMQLTAEELEHSKTFIKQLYNQGSSSLKENYIFKYYHILYKAINENTNENISWIEKVFLFKEGLSETPKCLVNKCTSKTSFSPSNQRYSFYCEKHIRGFNSKPEMEIFNYVNSLVPDVKKHWICGNNINKKYNISRIELDVYSPSLKLAFEHNGVYYHSDKFIKNKTNKNYHLNKWNICKDNGIQLITIWGDDWIYKKNIVKSIINYKINNVQNKIYAIKCTIKLVDTNESKKFLTENHLQGNCISSIKLGLYYNDELVSLMLFSKRKINNHNQFELLRFCSKINIIVVGAASKLFKYFLINYNQINQKIVSYANCDISNGSLYKRLGFKEIGHSKVNYWWVNHNIKIHRNNFMHYKLVKQGFDPNKTENEIMRERGYSKIWDTGNLIYVYQN
jgi:hypothetical protein